MAKPWGPEARDGFSSRLAGHVGCAGPVSEPTLPTSWRRLRAARIPRPLTVSEVRGQAQGADIAHSHRGSGFSPHQAP